MNFVIFVHPPFLRSQSMPRYAQMLLKGMRMRGHRVEIWMPKPRFFRIPLPKSMKKWMGYIDQYIIFPLESRRLIKVCPRDTVFVFADQALGPWVPLVADLPHVIHCHDFLALRSALGDIPENATGWTGKQYQNFIRRGFSRGRNFISVSQRTRHDLQRFLLSPPSFSEVVYNGLNQCFRPYDITKARCEFGNITGIDLTNGYVLHVGGNQWYKNRIGVIEIYNAWRLSRGSKLPLLLIGELPSDLLLERHAQSSFKDDIHFLCGINDENVRLAYAGASIFLFPSLAEGFGWPIAEAMASGCPVVTTNEAPMTEVAGTAGFFIPRRPTDHSMITVWANEAAEVVQNVIGLSAEERTSVVSSGIENAKRFDTEQALDRIELIYNSVIKADPNENITCYSKHGPF